LMSVSKPEIFIIQKLLEALASQIDLHYNANEYHTLGPAFVQMANAVLYLEDCNESVPANANELIVKFRDGCH
jgi:hypothetical protein